MHLFYFDLLLCLLTYGILLVIIYKGSMNVIRRFNPNDQDDEGGLLFDYEKRPVLDLPPGVRWPSGPVGNNKKHEEWVN